MDNLLSFKAISASQIAIDKRQIYRRLGYCHGDIPGNPVAALIEESIEEARHLIKPSYTYHIMDVRFIRGPKITLANGTGITLTSDVLSRVLQPCEQATVFVCSIGSKIEERVAVLNKEGLLGKALIMDAIGSEAVEQLACSFQDEIKRIAKKAQAEITRRFSPGYCDWDIKQQKLIFKNLDAALAGVSLSDECLMSPRKSISGIIGIGWTEKRRLMISPCRHCANKNCKDRR